jgi:excisionase family DNA binding protein
MHLFAIAAFLQTCVLQEHAVASGGPSPHQLHAIKEHAMLSKKSLVPLAHSPLAAAERVGISTRAVYSHIAAGDLASFKVGKRRLIAESELQRFLAYQIRAAK